MKKARSKTPRRPSENLNHRPKHLVTLAVPEGVGKLLQRAPDELGLLPQVGGKETVCVGNGRESGLQGVLEGLGRAGRRCVGILDTSKLEETLDSGRGNQGGTTGSRDKLLSIVMSDWALRNVLIKFFLNGVYLLQLTRTVTEPHLPLSLTGSE